jgi:hypothetical protein
MATATIQSGGPVRELPQALDWLNLAQPARLSELRGRVCVLAFVNSGSTWSLHCLEDLARLQARFGSSLQVLAIDVPRFDHERDRLRVAQRAARHAFGFPIGHDRDWLAWQQYGIEAWPTLLLVDAEGNERGRIVGRGEAPGSGRVLEGAIAQLLAEQAHLLTGAPALAIRPLAEADTSLRFPMGLAVTGKYLYIADSGHHRVLECDHAGRVLRQFGTGRPGFHDGASDTASFARPHGLAIQRGALYVADTGNHAVRRIDLRSGEVLTLLGTGRAGSPREGQVAAADTVALDHPQAIALVDDMLFVACSGDNRLWQYQLGTRQLQLAAGSGVLEVNDGAGSEAAFAEPMALAAVQQLLYVCDAAGSAIRSFNIRNRQAATLLGQGPWEHGSTDGLRSQALLQHPHAIALDPGAPLLWIADTGNNLMRTLRLGGGQLEMVALPQPLHGPCGLAVADGVVWIADTHAHAILRLEVASGALYRLPVGE